MPKTSTEKAILSKNGESEVSKKMIAMGIGNKSIALCRSINKYFFQQAFPDNSVDQIINLEGLKEQKSLESLLGCSLEEKDFKFTLKEEELPPNLTIEKLLGDYLFKDGFSSDVVLNFHRRKTGINTKTFKSLCKFLDLNYNEVVENTQNVNLSTTNFTLQDALVSKFNHTEEKQHLHNRLAHYNQRLPVLYKGIDILSLKSIPSPILGRRRSSRNRMNTTKRTNACKNLSQ